MRWLSRAAAVVGIGLLYALLGTAVAGALFNASDSDAMSVASKRVFPTTQASPAWDVQDTSAGTAAVTSTDVWSAVDGRLFTTAALPLAFASTRYVELTLSNQLPTAIPVSSVTLNLTMAESGGGTACTYVEIRRASNNALLGTQGSSASPLVCSSTTTQVTTTSALTYVTSSTDADDLKVKIFVRNSSLQKIAFDRVTVTGTAYSSTFTLNETTASNSSSGTATATPWALATNDSTTYSSSSAWRTTFDTARYLRFAFPTLVPTGATVTGVTLRHGYASATAVSTCTYVEIYNGATLVTSRGSSTTPYSCNTTTTQATDVISLPEVNTDTEVNNLVVRIYVRNATPASTRHGLLTLTVDYALT
jgi:hypothetical protein